jgi:hypothetical protein
MMSLGQASGTVFTKVRLKSYAKQRGAYILKDKANSLLPFRFPPSHLKLVPKSEALMEKSYAIKRILAHAAITDQPDKFDYYVQFAIPDSTPVWISAEMFDSTIPIEQYWKGARQLLKAKYTDMM